MADNLVKFAQGLPLVKDQTSTYSLSELVVDLIDHAKSNMTSNAIVVPVFQTLNILLEADVLRQLSNEVSGLSRRVTWKIGNLLFNTEIFSLTSLLHMSSKNIDRVKNVQRIQEAMKTWDLYSRSWIFAYKTSFSVVNLVTLDQFRKEKVSTLRSFLAHPFPTVGLNFDYHFEILVNYLDRYVLILPNTSTFFSKVRTLDLKVMKSMKYS